MAPTGIRELEGEERFIWEQERNAPDCPEMTPKQGRSCFFERPRRHSLISLNQTEKINVWRKKYPTISEPKTFRHLDL